MGEQKRRGKIEQEALNLTNKLFDRKQLILGGFAAYCIVHKIEPTEPHIPLLFDAYMAGAEHLWSSIIATLDPETEPTEADMKRMDAIAGEIEEWRNNKEAYFAKAMKTKGSA